MEFSLKLQESFETLLQEPERFNEITRTTIIQLAKIHNTHNRLLPPSLVAQIINQLHAVKPFQNRNRKNALKFSFYYNIIRHISLANFHQLKDNKIFAVIAMIYAQKLTQFYHELKFEQKSFVILKQVAQMTIINQITLKYLQRSKIFFPEYIKSMNLCVQKLQYGINRNIRHEIKNHSLSSSNAQQFTTINSVLNLAFSKDSSKNQLLYILIGLLTFVLKQAGSFFNANAHKKELLKLKQVQQTIERLQNLVNSLPQQIGSQLLIPAEFKKYQINEDEQKQIILNGQNQPIYLEQPIQFRELTPRFYNEQESTKIKLLRKKKNKLQKKMHLQLQQSTTRRIQQRQVIQNVKKDKIQRQVKKQIFVLQKQTQQAKKYHKQQKKVKTIKKQGKLGRKGKK